MKPVYSKTTTKRIHNSELHVKVKDILQAHSPDEYARIFES
ncbi:hypothetical protein [Pseudoalteromonas sp. OFAV1]|nr:hypothetical protein [Pseudoalteromonas sp. OFAV1]